MPCKPGEEPGNHFPARHGKYGPRESDQTFLPTFYGLPSITTRLLEYCEMDVVFVSIDFENTEIICGCRPSKMQKLTEAQLLPAKWCQVGLAILDPRDLSESPETIVTTRQFCVDAGADWYRRNAANDLLFGSSESISTMHDLSTTLTESLRFVDPITNMLRPIVVIGFTLRQNAEGGDLACLNKLTDPSLRSPIIDYLDIRDEREVLRPLAYRLGEEARKAGRGYKVSAGGWKGPRLSEILEYLAIPYTNLHVAANDATFTLRAMLTLAVRDYQNTDLTMAEEKILSKFQDIALMPLIPPPSKRFIQHKRSNVEYLVTPAGKPNPEELRQREEIKSQEKNDENRRRLDPSQRKRLEKRERKKDRKQGERENRDDPKRMPLRDLAETDGFIPSPWDIEDEGY